jgi:hypothetical protein
MQDEGGCLASLIPLKPELCCDLTDARISNFESSAKDKLFREAVPKSKGERVRLVEYSSAHREHLSQ